MPNYHSWEDMGLKVKVRDQNIWKNIFRKWNYYYIGDIVKLVIYIERLPPDYPYFQNIRIAEKFPTKDYVRRKIGPGKSTFTKVKFAIRGDVLDESGDVIWRLEICSKDGKVEKSRLIFDAGISSRDNQRRDIILVALAFLFSLPSCIIAALQLWLQYKSRGGSP